MECWKDSCNKFTIRSVTNLSICCSIAVSFVRHPSGFLPRFAAPAAGVPGRLVPALAAAWLKRLQHIPSFAARTDKNGSHVSPLQIFYESIWIYISLYETLKPFFGGSLLKHLQRLGICGQVQAQNVTSSPLVSALAPAFFLEGSNLSIQGIRHRHVACSTMFMAHNVPRSILMWLWRFRGSERGTSRNPWSEPATNKKHNVWERLGKDAKNGISIQACIKKKALNQDSGYKGMTRPWIDEQSTIFNS